MSGLRISLFSLVLLALLGASALAYGPPVEVTLKKGNQFRGEVMAWEKSGVRIKVEGGGIRTVPFADLDSLRLLEDPSRIVTGLWVTPKERSQAEPVRSAVAERLAEAGSDARIAIKDRGRLVITIPASEQSGLEYLSRLLQPNAFSLYLERPLKPMEAERAAQGWTPPSTWHPPVHTASDVNDPIPYLESDPAFQAGTEVTFYWDHTVNDGALVWSFTERGQEKLGRLIRAHSGTNLYVLVDGQLLSSWALSPRYQDAPPKELLTRVRDQEWRGIFAIALDHGYPGDVVVERPSE